MSIILSNSFGQIVVTTEVIADIVGFSAMQCAGVVGMASQKRVKDGVSELLKRENYSKGIIVKSENNEIEVNLHLVILYGVKIAQIASTVQARVKHELEEIVGIKVRAINIIIEDVKVDA